MSEQIEKVLEYQSKINNSLCRACEYGNKQIVEFLIEFLISKEEKGANNFQAAMESAYLGGHNDIIELLTSKGVRVYNCYLHQACKGGHINIIENIIAKFKDNYCDGDGDGDIWNYGLSGACRGGHMEIVELMISKGANKWNSCISDAYNGGNREIALMMIRKGATNWTVDE